MGWSINKDNFNLMSQDPTCSFSTTHRLSSWVKVIPQVCNVPEVRSKWSIVERVEPLP